MSLQDFRQQHPEYQDVPDEVLIPSLHQKFYSDVPYNDFVLKMGLGPRRPPESEGATGIAKALGSGAVKGAVAGTLGIPGDMANMGGQAVAALTGDPTMAEPGPIGRHGSDYFLKKLEGAGVEMHKPVGAGEHFADSSAAGATSMLLGKLKTLPMRALVGALGGAGGEAGSEFMSQNPEEDSPIARIVSTLAMQMIPGYATMRKPQAVKALKKDLKDISDPQLRAAAEKAQETKDTLGTEVTLPQGFMDPTALSGVSQELVRSGSGDVLRRVLSNQLPVGQEHIDNIVASLSKLPTDTQTENRVAAAGTKVFDRAKDVRKNLTEPYYEAANHETVPVNLDKLAPPPGTTAPTAAGGVQNKGQTVQGVQAPLNGTTYAGVTNVDVATVIGNLRKRREDLNLSGTPAGDAMDRYIKRVVGMAARYPEGVPVNTLDSLAKQARDAAEAAGREGATASEVQRKLGHSAVSQVINEATTAASANLAQGKQLHSRFSKTVTDPLETSPLGEMFPSKMRDSGKGDWNAFSRVLEDPGMGPRDITFAAENLRRADPAAFPAIVKQNWLAKADSARTPVAGRPPQSGLGDWATAVAGAPGSAQRDKFRETIKQVSLSNGLPAGDAADAVKGAEAVIDALHVISRDRGGLGNINPEELRRASGSNAVSAGMKTANVMAPFQTLGRAIERVVQQKTYSAIAEALSSPEGVEKLIHIARWHQPKQIAVQFARGLVMQSAEHQSATYQPTE